MIVNPYIECPKIESNFFNSISWEDDCEDLLACYLDKETIKIVNRDNCPIDFYFDSQDELRKLIKFWLWEYSNHGYVRFSIIDRGNYKAIGTIEILRVKKLKMILAK